MNVVGSIPIARSNSLRGWYIDCALAFQASETSLSLVPRSIFAPVAQLVEVPVLETVGCQFESDLGHQLNTPA